MRTREKEYCECQHKTNRKHRQQPNTRSKCGNLVLDFSRFMFSLHRFIFSLVHILFQLGLVRCRNDTISATLKKTWEQMCRHSTRLQHMIFTFQIRPIPKYSLNFNWIASPTKLNPSNSRFFPSLCLSLSLWMARSHTHKTFPSFLPPIVGLFFCSALFFCFVLVSHIHTCVCFSHHFRFHFHATRQACVQPIFYMANVRRNKIAVLLHFQ